MLTAVEGDDAIGPVNWVTLQDCLHYVVRKDGFSMNTRGPLHPTPPGGLGNIT